MGGVSRLLSVAALVAASVLCLPIAPARAAGRQDPAGERRVPEDAAPEIRRLEVLGSSVYGPEGVESIVRLHPGDRLRRAPEVAAATLEQRYHDDGYFAARVSGSFDASTGSLSLDVDEGRLGEVVVAGLGRGAEERAIAELGLEPGRVLRRWDVVEAIDRLERASGGALVEARDPAYTAEPMASGQRRLVLHLRAPTTRLRLALRDPDDSGLYDRVEGFAPFFGAALTLFDRSSYQHLEAYARGSYGFASDGARFAFGARRPFGPLTPGYEFHDLTDTDDGFRATSLEETLGTALFHSSFRDDFRRRGHEAYAAVDLGHHAQAGLTWRGDTYESLRVESEWSLFRRDRPTRPNPAVEAGRMRSLIASLSWTSQAEAGGGKDDGLPLRDLYGAARAPGDGVRADASLEVASPGALGGDFDFTRLVAHLRARRGLTARQAISGRGLLGLSGGTLPLQKRFALGGLGTLRGYHFKEFAGENLALVTGEWSVELPLPVRLALFYDGGAVWTAGVGGPGWRSDVGAGVELLAAGRVVLRVDLGIPLDREGGRDRARLTARLLAPF